MLRHRKVLLAATLTFAGGPFYAALGYGVYLHSDYYRAKKERELQRFLELPASIGSVRPQNYYRADFLDIHVWLAGRRAEIFRCDRAEMHELPKQGEAFGLVIRNGRLTIDADAWQNGDYRHVLRSGLAHDFAALQLRWVDLFDVDVAWRQGPVAFAVRGATGRIQFEPPSEDRPDGEGRISIVGNTLNDTHTDERIEVVARFKPSRDLAVHEVILRVPSLPVRALGLEPMLGVSQARGRFQGRLCYHGNDGGPRVSLEGRAEGIDLADWTTNLDVGPLHGKFDLAIDRAEVTDQGLVHARFSGRASDLRLGELARMFGVAPIDGSAELEVLNAEFGNKHLVRMSLRGEVTDVSLAPFVALIGSGKIAGKIRLTINALDLADDELVSADIDVEVVPPKSKPATLDTSLIIQAARKFMGVELPALIATPLEQLETVTYSRFGFKLLADEGQLRVLGTHGPGGRAILTVKVFGTDLAVVTQPEKPFELAPLIAKLRSSGQEKIRQLIKRYQPTPTTMPAGR